MKISKCCKATIGTYMPDGRPNCLECWQPCQFWELDDCEILTKKEYRELKNNAAAWLDTCEQLQNHLGKNPRLEFGTDKRKLRTKRRPSKSGGATNSSKGKRGGDSIPANKKAKGKRQVR